MRILKGTWAGRDLTSPARRIRPTPEKARDFAVGVVESDFKGERVLDLFAGTGALGLEALSRGAQKVDFVENAAAALHSLKANVAALRVRGKTRIFKRDALPWIQAVPEGRYAVAFIDPPYGSMKLDRVLERWVEVPFARVLVVEHDKEHKLAVRGKWTDFDGKTRVTILRA